MNMLVPNLLALSQLSANRRIRYHNRYYPLHQPTMQRNLEEANRRHPIEGCIHRGKR